MCLVRSSRVLTAEYDCRWYAIVLHVGIARVALFIFPTSRERLQNPSSYMAQFPFLLPGLIATEEARATAK